MSIRGVLVPPIKCQGIKTKLVPWIKAVIPDDFSGHWIEPFMGSGVLVFNVRPKKALPADSNPHIISFYQAVAKGKIAAAITRQFLEREGKQLLRSNGEHYYSVRERFNRYGDPLDFLFLNRACFNGLIRFNQRGKFNVPFCRKPNRFTQAYITKICNQVQAVADVCASGDYQFRCQDYSRTVNEASARDILYCDHPYFARHNDYVGGWDDEHERRLAKLLAETPARFILSTWYGNEFRKNQLIDTVWSRYNISTTKHFYHVGAREVNRNPVIEALVMNFVTVHYEQEPLKRVN